MLLIISLKTSFARFSSVKTLPITWKGRGLLSWITCYLLSFAVWKSTRWRMAFSKNPPALTTDKRLHGHDVGLAFEWGRSEGRHSRASPGALAQPGQRLQSATEQVLPVLSLSRGIRDQIHNAWHPKMRAWIHSWVDSALLISEADQSWGLCISLSNRTLRSTVPPAVCCK